MTPRGGGGVSRNLTDREDSYRFLQIRGGSGGMGGGGCPEGAVPAAGGLALCRAAAKILK